MAQQTGQPEVRFTKAGPFGREGLSYVEKVLAFKKENISGTSNDDFWQAPAGTVITQAVIRCETALDGTPTVTLGTDGDPDALINSTDFDATSAGNWATNLGSGTAAGANGLYLDAGDAIRLAIGGSPTQGAVEGYIKYMELDSVKEQGFHFDFS